MSVQQIPFCSITQTPRSGIKYGGCAAAYLGIALSYREPLQNHSVSWTSCAAPVMAWPAFCRSRPAPLVVSQADSATSAQRITALRIISFCPLVLVSCHSARNACLVTVCLMHMLVWISYSKSICVLLNLPQFSYIFKVRSCHFWSRKYTCAKRLHSLRLTRSSEFCRWSFFINFNVRKVEFVRFGAQWILPRNDCF